jgi:hypothetical protein
LDNQLHHSSGCVVGGDLIITQQNSIPYDKEQGDSPGVSRLDKPA